jgi:hypothetical protein
MAILGEVLGTCELKSALSLLPHGGISSCIVAQSPFHTVA